MPTQTDRPQYTCSNNRRNSRHRRTFECTL